MKKQKQAFTLVELIVVITILAILGTIAFITLQGYGAQARDSKRLSDIQNIKKSLELFSINTGVYPLSDNPQQVTYDGDLVWTQGIVGKKVTKNLSKNLNELPLDPLSEQEYIYSTINSQNKYEVLSIYESNILSQSNNLINGTLAASTNFHKIDGNYNGIFVKTSRYYIPTPSIITSENISGGLNLNGQNIKSQIITGGKNQISVGLNEISTGQLNIKLIVYTGSINNKTIDDKKEDLAEIIQKAYTDSSLANNGIYKTILDTNGKDNLVNLINSVVLNSVSNISSKKNTSCDSVPNQTSKDFYDVSGVEPGFNCETHKKTFICDNAVWKDGENVADTNTYHFESCNVADDTSAPTGGNFSIPSSTNLVNVTLTITCPIDAAGSNPIEMLITGDMVGTSSWETCISSKSIELSGTDGIKNISIKWKDSLENETGEINKSTNFTRFLFNSNKGIVWVKSSNYGRTTGTQWAALCASVGKKIYSCYNYGNPDSGANKVYLGNSVYDSSSFSLNCPCGNLLDNSSGLLGYRVSACYYGPDTQWPTFIYHYYSQYSNTGNRGVNRNNTGMRDRQTSLENQSASLTGTNFRYSCK